MPLSLFFLYSSDTKDKDCFIAINNMITPYIKKNNFICLNSDDENQLESNIQNADVIIVLLSDNYLLYDLNITRKKVHEKLTGYHKSNAKKTIPIEVFPCLWQLDEAFENNKELKFVKDQTFSTVQEIISLIDDFNKTSTINQKPKEAIKNSLQKGLFSLNFEEQGTKLKSHYKLGLQNINIILVKGTEKCGQRLLLNSFLSLKNKEYDKSESWVYISAKKFSQSNDEKWIWQEIGTSLSIPGIPTLINKDVVIRKIKERLETNSLFINFRDTHLVDESWIKIINIFWEEVFTHFKNENITPKHNIFIFITHTSEDDTEFKHTQFIEKTDISECTKLLCILPKISYLSQEGVKKWLENPANSVDIDLLAKYINPEDIIADLTTLIPMKDAVEKTINVLLEKVSDEDLMDNKDYILNYI